MTLSVTMLLKRITAVSSSVLLSTSALLLGRKPNNKDGQPEDEISPRIAIIGGGIGGTSCAYFLRELLGETAQIDLYEDNLIGGRLKTLPVDGREYEFGGSIIHPRNKYMVDYAKKFGLKKRGSVMTLTGAYNGEEFVFEESSWGLITGLKMIWQYGWKDVWMLGREVGHMLNTFASIYDLQAEGKAFLTVRDMLTAMGGDEFIKWAETPMDQVFREKKFTDKFISEVVSLATRTSYGQDPDMTAFAGTVALAGVEAGLWSVQGGNKLVAEKFLAESVKTAIHRQVTEVTLKSSTDTGRPLFEVAHSFYDDQQVGEYDIVIVAVPLTAESTQAPLRFEGFPAPIGPFPGRYQTTVTTYIKGTLNSEAFGKKPGDYLPESIITTRDIPLKIRTVAKNFPVDVKTGDKSVWAYKIFSQNELSSKQLQTLFTDVTTTTHVSWHAYPLYQKVDLDKVAPFKLHEGLFHVNAIEWAASCMEMSVIGAKNVALLAKEYWGGGK